MIKPEHMAFLIKAEKELRKRAEDALMAARVAMSDSSLRSALAIGDDIMGAVASIAEKPTPITVAKTVVNLGRVLSDHAVTSPDLFFSCSGKWCKPFSVDFSSLIVESLESFPRQEIDASSNGKSYVIVVDLGDGAKVGWYVHDKFDACVRNVYVSSDNLNLAREKLKEILWLKFKDSSIVMRNNKIDTAASRATAVFERDVMYDPLPSKQADEYAAYLRRCLDAGVARSVLLYGPPGTGKSTMAATLVMKLHLRSFRVKVNDLANIDNTTVFSAINIFQPDAVIFDDFDRTKDQSSLLEIMEFLQRRVKLVIATVNDKTRLEQAVLRPGRFDELVSVRILDADVVRAILGPDNADVFETVKEWPVAFIHELVKRRRFMSRDAAISSVEELRERVKSLRYDDDVNQQTVGLSDERASIVDDIIDDDDDSELG